MSAMQFFIVTCHIALQLVIICDLSHSGKKTINPWDEEEIEDNSSPYVFLL